MVYRLFENRHRSPRWDLRHKNQVRTNIRLLYERPANGNTSNRKIFGYNTAEKLSQMQESYIY